MSWANITRVLAQNLQNLGATIGGIAINAFRPFLASLNGLILKLNEFAIAVANSLGKIFGWTYDEGSGGSSLGDVAEDAEGVSDGLGSAADNAKKLKQQLQGFDQLNVLTSDKDSSSGGGSGSGGGGGASASGGEWKKADSIFKNYESELDTLGKLGEAIGTKLTEALNNIPWDEVYENARSFGSGLAEFLNGLISPELYGALGATIANAINTIGQALNGFGTTFDWENNGRSIASFFNEFNNNIDWELAFDNAKTYGVGIGQEINAFVDELDVDAMATTFANVINTLSEFVLDLGTTIEFDKIGEKLGKGLTTFFEELDTGKLARAIKTWITGALTLLITFFKNTDFELIGNKIGEFLSKLDLSSYLDDIATLIWEAIKSAFELLKGMFEEAPLETSLLVAFGVLKFTGVGKLVASKLKTAILTNVKTAFSGIGSSIASSITIDGVGVSLWTLLTTDIAAIFTEGSLAAIGATIATGLVGSIVAAIGGLSLGNWLGDLFFPDDTELYDTYSGISGMIQLFKDLGSAIAFVAENIWEDFKNSIGSAATWMNQNVITPVTTFFKNLGTDIFGFFNTAWTKIKNVWNTVTTFFENICTKVGGFFGTLWANIQAVWNTVSNWFNTYVITPIATIFEGVTSRIGAIFEGCWIIVQATWKIASDWFNTNVITPIQTLFSVFKNTVATLFSSLWAGIKGVWNSANSWFESTVINPIKSAFTAFKNTVSTLFSSLWSGIKGVWNAAKSWFDNTVIAPIKSAFSAFKSTVSTIFSSLWAGIKGVWSKATQWFKNTVTDPVKNLFDNLGTKIKAVFSSVAAGIKGSLKAAFNWVGTGIEKVINGIIDAINGILGGFNKIVTVAASIIGADWSGVSTLTHINVPSFETGGFVPRTADLFMANENNVPELVGTVGGKTAVASNYEITGISDAIYDTAEEELKLLRQQNQLLSQLLAKDYGISANDIFNSVRSSDREYANINGRSAFGY